VLVKYIRIAYNRHKGKTGDFDRQGRMASRNFFQESQKWTLQQP
jgi:hypothetical protein